MTFRLKLLYSHYIVNHLAEFTINTLDFFSLLLIFQQVSLKHVKVAFAKKPENDPRLTVYKNRTIYAQYNSKNAETKACWDIQEEVFYLSEKFMCVFSNTKHFL